MQESAYNNLYFDKIQGVLLGANKHKYQQNPYSYGYIEKAIIYYYDDTSEVLEFTDASDAKCFCNLMMEHNIDIERRTYYMTQKIWKTAYKDATKEQHNLKLKKALIAGGIIAGVGAIATASGAIGYKLGNKEDKKITTDSNNNDDLSETQGYGFYKYDLSTFEGVEQYQNEVPDSFQKTNSLNYLNILQSLNQEITLVNETKQLGGLTIEQLIAVDAFSNSNIYTTDDYVKNFGLYDFSNLNVDFQQAAMVMGAYLAIPETDGTVLANIFKDETVKEFYLKALEHQQKILNAENSKERKQNVKDFEEFMNDVAVDQASENYIDFSMHPGMSFATTSIINSLNYNNVKLSSKLISNIIIIGDEEQQSKLDSICSNVYAKIDDAKNLISSMSSVLANNQTIKMYNITEVEKANAENRTPNLMVLEHGDLDTLLTEVLCDQVQINTLINKELEKTNQLVTIEDQQKIIANGTEISRKLQNSTDVKTSGKTKKEIEIEKQLEEKGVAVIIEEKKDIVTPEQKQDLIKSNPEEVAKAKQELNEKEGLIANDTEEEQQQAENKINQEVANTAIEGVNYVNQVVAYYEANGDVAGIPNELQNAYNNLGADTFNTCKNTGVMRWTVKNQPTTGGEIEPLPGMENVDTNANVTKNEVSNEVIAPDFSTKSEENNTPNVNQNESISSNVNQSESASSNVNTPTTEEEKNEVIAPDFSNQEENTVTEPTVTPSNGEITILPGFEDIDITDISADPVSTYANVSITEEDINNYLNTEEGLQFLQDMTASESQVEESAVLIK